MKLLSPVAEVTILLYKSHINEKKMIGIRRINVMKHDQPASKTEMDTARSQILDELKHAGKELAQIKEEKETLLASLKAEIDKEKKNWEEEKKKWIEAAEKEGYESGFLQGKEESIDQYSNLIEQANSLTETALQDYNKTIEKSEETILKLAIHTAGKILTHKLKEEPAIFLPIVKAAIKELKDQRIITIHVHPDHYSTVVEQKDELAHILEDDMKLSIYANEELDVNGCFIHHPFGQIDASVDTQLEQIRKTLSEIAVESKS